MSAVLFALHAVLTVVMCRQWYGFGRRRGRREAAMDIRSMYIHASTSYPLAESCAKIAEGGR